MMSTTYFQIVQEKIDTTKLKNVNNYWIQVVGIWVFTVVFFQLFCMFEIFLIKESDKKSIFYTIFGWHKFVPATMYFGRTDAFTKISVPAFLLSFSEKAYLSRVAYYGLKGRYSKAILSCNEAIQIYPQSVRAYLYRGVLKYYNKVRQFPTLFSGGILEWVAARVPRRNSLPFYPLWERIAMVWRQNYIEGVTLWQYIKRISINNFS